MNLNLQLFFAQTESEAMRPSLLLRQVAAGAPTMAKLPLPQIYPSNPVPRLKPPQEQFLPSIINAPTTLPPVFIEPKVADPTAWWRHPKNRYWQAQSYFKFYRAGINQIRENRKIRKILKNELNKSLTNVNIPGSANVAITRSEFQMLIRTKRDSRKMPRKFTCFLVNVVFVIALLIFGEFTPIIIWLFGSSFFPGTCIPPNQLDKRRRKRMDDLERKRLPVTPRVTPTVEQVKELPRKTVIHECRYSLQLYC
jgi:hypothetical protein